ncbi:MAG: hypothetical protein KGR71_11535 [Proteobacteria bacterium]|nr:hypothetical protein [Pseudomonadota bacterium]
MFHHRAFEADWLRGAPERLTLVEKLKCIRVLLECPALCRKIGYCILLSLQLGLVFSIEPLASILLKDLNTPLEIINSHVNPGFIIAEGLRCSRIASGTNSEDEENHNPAHRLMLAPPIQRIHFAPFAFSPISTSRRIAVAKGGSSCCLPAHVRISSWNCSDIRTPTIGSFPVAGRPRPFLG